MYVRYVFIVYIDYASISTDATRLIEYYQLFTRFRVWIVLFRCDNLRMFVYLGSITNDTNNILFSLLYF